MPSPWSKELPLERSAAGDGSPADAWSPNGAPLPLAEPEALRAAPPTRWRLPLLLFVLTVLTTLLAGAMLKNVNPFSSPTAILAGIPFSVTLLSILLIHEMGHYVTARHYRIQATLPYFIPAPPIPFIIGTFGAFIRMKSPIVERKALLEVGAAGPIAGFVVALLAIIVGLQWSTIAEKGI
ncbi:MAG: site-2 protease family protein, partial [Nitrospirota bacterium]